jgi:hypothetical protein
MINPRQIKLIRTHRLKQTKNGNCSTLEPDPTPSKQLQFTGTLINPNTKIIHPEQSMKEPRRQNQKLVPFYPTMLLFMQEEVE